MLAQKKIFNEAVSRLNTIYKDDASKRDAINLTAKIALEAFEIGGLSSNMGNTTIPTRPQRQFDYKSSTPVVKEPPKPVDPRAAEMAQQYMTEWAKADPVACQRWLNSTLKTVIDNAAQAKFNFSFDEDGWQSAWKKAVAGDAESDDAALKRAQEHAKEAEEKLAAQKAEEERKANMAEAKRMEKEWRENQKRLGKEYKEKQREEAKEASRQQHRDALDNMDFEDEIYNKAREYAYRDGRDPNMYKSTKDRSFLTKGLRGLRRWWHKKMADLNCAMGNGDMAMVESIKADLLKFQAFCESYGYTVDEVILG